MIALGHDRGLFLVVTLLLILSACKQRNVSIEELARRDSLMTLVEQEQQKVTYRSPREEFFSSLAVRTLPLSFSETFIMLLPGFTAVPTDLTEPLFGIEGFSEPSAIALPDAGRYHVALLAGKLDDGDRQLFLVTLDADYRPVDQLQIYHVMVDVDDSEVHKERLDFSITSRYEIYMLMVTLNEVDESQQLIEGVEYVITKEGKIEEKGELKRDPIHLQ